MTVWNNLTRFLENCQQNEIHLPIEDIATIVIDLPDSAYKYREFWANSRNGRPHSVAWLDAGFKTGKVIMQEDVATQKSTVVRVPFVRDTSATRQTASIPIANEKNAVKQNQNNMGSAFKALTHHLENCGQDEFTLTLEEIIEILSPRELTNRMCTEKQSWLANSRGTSFCCGWLNAGYRVTHVSLENQRVHSVTFSKEDTLRIQGDVPRNAEPKTVLTSPSTLGIDKALASIRKFYDTTTVGVHTRYRSWEHCYKAFRDNRHDPAKKDHLYLHLAAYLASWGMYRGGSFLLTKVDYQVHIDVAHVLLRDDYANLFDIEHVSSDRIDQIWDLSVAIKNAYPERYRSSVSDTLITKILLGVFGCAPAYDRYFKYTAKKYKVGSGSWSKKSLKDIWGYYENHREDFEKLRHELRWGEDGNRYPPMKLMDMCLWQIGFDEDPNNKKEEKIPRLNLEAK